VKLRRDIASVPLRTGAATWDKIVELITGPDSIDTAQLGAASSVMATLLAEEIYADHPLTLKGKSHRLVIYCVYGGDALIAGEDVDALSWNPTSEDWTLFVPCGNDDRDWAGRALKDRAPRITLHPPDENPSDLSEASEKSGAKALTIDWGAA
jgi:hypothetical protein